MPLQYIQGEILLAHTLEKELYELKMPLIQVIKRDPDESVTNTNLGVRVTNTFVDPVTVNADWNRDKKLKELRDGIWVATNKINVIFCRYQLLTQQREILPEDPEEEPTIEDYELVIVPGDLVVLDPDHNQEMYEILSVAEKDWIPGSSIPLHLEVVIDLEHVWAE